MSEIWRDEVHEKDRKEKLATYLFAMKEDLSEWIAGLMNIPVNADSFMTVLDNGTHLCRLANMIQKAAEKYLTENPDSALKLPGFVPTYKERGATHGSFVSRDNVANFIRWCRELGIQDVIIFESEDLVLHKFQKPVILTLLDVARRASKFDIEPPDLVIMEEQIDEEIALEQLALAGQQSAPISHVETRTNHHAKPIVVKSKTQQKPTPKKVKNFIPKNLDTLVSYTLLNIEYYVTIVNGNKQYSRAWLKNLATKNMKRTFHALPLAVRNVESILCVFYGCSVLDFIQLRTYVHWIFLLWI